MSKIGKEGGGVDMIVRIAHTSPLNYVPAV